MSSWERDRTVYRLYTDDALLAAYRIDPPSALAGLDLTPREAAMIATCDVAALYLDGVHPNLIRNFAATVGVDYVDGYRKAGLRDD
jgi:hypothetical protein